MNNPKSRQQWILEQLTQQLNLSYGDCWSIYKVEWSKGESTFAKDWKKAQASHNAIQAKTIAAKEDAIISEKVKATKLGIRTKAQRILLLQEQADVTLDELKSNEVQETKIQNGKAISITREMTVFEKARLRRVFRDLQAEISKIEGDYAAEKIDSTYRFIPRAERIK